MTFTRISKMPSASKECLRDSLIIAPLLLSLTCIVGAAEAVPVRPGLWEISASGPSISERIKNTPPDKRQAMEQAAGISIRGEIMVRRACITPEMLKQGISIKNRSNCELKQVWKGRVTKINYQCPNGGSGKGELTYSDKENYKGWMNSQQNQNTKKPVRVLQSGKWMAKDCAAKNN
jgi:Protein of unknown function (DUF3617)